VEQCSEEYEKRQAERAALAKECEIALRDNRTANFAP
jgi:hypothetical protein